MKIIEMKLGDIKPYENNPREIESAVAHVAESIKRFGFRQPIVVDSANIIIVGHVRYHAALKLGLEKVPVHVASDMAQVDIDAYRLADNKLGELAGWNLEGLSDEIQKLDSQGYSIEMLGFSSDELASLVAGVEAELTPILDIPDDIDERVPEPPKKPISKPGDIYQIGPHRLICGDSTQLDTYKALFGDEKAQMVFTDPPYNVAYEGGTDEKLTIMNDKMDASSFMKFLSAFYLSARLYTVVGGGIYVCHADSEWHAFRTALVRTKWELKQCLIWVKNSIVLGRMDYQYQHEPILYGWKPGGPHRWYGGRNQASVWDFPKPMRNGVHPTMKPIALVEKAIQNSSQPGEIVFDGFGCSGSTMVAAHMQGRRARLIELDPKYCDVIVSRMRDLFPDLTITKNGDSVAA